MTAVGIAKNMKIRPGRTAVAYAVVLMTLGLGAWLVAAMPSARAQEVTQEAAADAPAATTPEEAEVAEVEAEPPPAPRVPFYIHPLWFLLFGLTVGLWLFLTSCVSMDAKGLGTVSSSLWSAAMMGTGFIGLAFTVLFHVAFAFLMIGVVLATGAIYVWHRNRFVPERHRLLGAHHRAELLSRLPLVGGLVGYAPGFTAEIDVDLSGPGGESLESIVTQDPAFNQAAEVMADAVSRAAAVNARTVRVFAHDEQYVVQLVMDGVPQTLTTCELDTGRQMIACASALLGLSSEGRVRQGSASLRAALPEAGTVEVQGRIKAVRQKPALVLEFPDWQPDLHKAGLEALGMHDALVKRLRTAVQQEKGAILVAGRAGSGTTTTLYATIALMDLFTTDVIALESEEGPEVEHVRRWPVPKDRPFGEVMAEVLREGPHKIVFDGLQAQEQAEPLLEFAARQGQVLTTLRGKNAPDALLRLCRTTGSADVVGQAVICVVAQRLVRRLCEECREQIEPDPQFLRKLNLDPADPGSWFQAVGCPHCLNTGYRGRIGLFSMLIMTDSVRKALAQREASPSDILAQAGKAAFRSFQQDGLSKVAAGITTLEEVRRVLKSSSAAPSD